MLSLSSVTVLNTAAVMDHFILQDDEDLSVPPVDSAEMAATTQACAWPSVNSVDITFIFMRLVADTQAAVWQSNVVDAKMHALDMPLSDEEVRDLETELEGLVGLTNVTCDIST